MYSNYSYSILATLSLQGKDNKIVFIQVYFPTLQHPDEEVDHKEDVEGQVYLLGGVLQPWYAGLHAVTELISSQTRNNYQVFVP